MVSVSHDTTAFAAHAIAHWWEHEGSLRYRRSRQILILSDTGGSNGYRCRAWKTELQSQLADSHGLTLTVAHYPTGASKWNTIEHRLFSEISKNWAGEPLDSYQKILRFALMAGLSEFFGGFLLALGFMGPVGPALMVSVMPIAIVTVHL